MGKKQEKKERRWRRAKRTRQKVFGTPDKPRLSVHRSNKHIYAQVIDDIRENTLAQASSLDGELKEEVKDMTLKEKSRKVGEKIAQRCLDNGVDEVVFDKGSFTYHGCVKNLAEGAREGGLKF